MPAQTPSTEITVGIIGPGIADDRAIIALLEDYFQDKEPTLVVPVTKAHYTDALDVTLSYAEDNDVPLLAITDGTTARNKSFREIADSAEKQYKADNVVEKLIEVLASVDTPAQLFLLWSDDSDNDAMTALEAATTKGIPTFDLCDGLTPIGFNSPSVEVDPEEVSAPAAVLESTEADEEAPRSRRGRKGAAEPESDAEPPKRRTRRNATPGPG